MAKRSRLQSPSQNRSPRISKEVWIAIISGTFGLIGIIVTGLFSIMKPSASSAGAESSPITLQTASAQHMIGNITPTGACPSDMIFIPSGDFWMGAHSNDSRHKPDEEPGREVFLDSFCIDKTEVSNAAYAVFVANAPHTPPPSAMPPQPDGWNGDQPPMNYKNLPIVRVSWEDAQAYCEWKGGMLPTEAQWEKAARGTEGNIYPWGNTWDSSRANSGETQGSSLRSVDSFPDGQSPYGVLNMSGNASEWVADWYDKDAYSYVSTSNPVGPHQGINRVVRGGSFIEGSALLRASVRVGIWPPRLPNLAASNFIGFRCSHILQQEP